MKNIVTKGDLRGKIKNFPLEVVQKMCEYQVKQGNDSNPGVFQNNSCRSLAAGGFDWGSTSEGMPFWNEVIDKQDFRLFFDKYPKQDKYPKLMEVSNSCNFTYPEQRVVFMEKCGKYLAWAYAKSFEEAEQIKEVTQWSYARDIVEEQIVELTIKDISEGKGIGVPPHLIRIKDDK